MAQSNPQLKTRRLVVEPRLVGSTAAQEDSEGQLGSQTWVLGEERLVVMGIWRY
jgi:hypothetical protein